MNGIHHSRLDKRYKSPTMSSGLGCCLCRHRSLESSCLPSNSMAYTSRHDTINRKRINHIRSKSMESLHEFKAIPTLSNSSRNVRMSHRMHSRNGSIRKSGTPIMYSNSSGILKLPPIEKILECTLEELCFGCLKIITITRDIFTNTGGVTQEEEQLTINVEPGWKNGTKITFEGKGNLRPNSCQEDIIVYISEKRHKLFRREGDDLELCVEIPLLKALTGCTLSVPLLGEEHMNLIIEDIIYPGYQKIIIDKGMPISTEPGKRGNLIIKFFVEFPTHLTRNQRSQVFAILQNSC